MQFELSIINGKTVHDLIHGHRSDCIRIVRDAYLAHAEGKSVNPDSYFRNRSPGSASAMTSISSRNGSVKAKIASEIPM